MVLKYPFVTEKAMMMLDKDSKLQFLVTDEATKTQIKREIEKTFEQEVTKRQDNDDDHKARRRPS